MRLLTLIILSVIGAVLAFDAEAPTDSPRDDTSLASPVVEKVNNEMLELKKSIANKVKKLRALKLETRHLRVQLRRDRRAKAIVSGRVENKSEQVRLRKWKHRMQRRVKEMLKRVVRMEKTMREQKAELWQHIQRGKAAATASRMQKKYKINHHSSRHPKKLNYQKHQKAHKVTILSPALTSTTPTTIPAHISLMTTAMTQDTKSFKSKQKRSHEVGTNGYPCATHKQCAPGHCCHRFGALTSIQASVCLQHDLVQGSVCGHSCACQGSMKCVRQVKKNKNQQSPAHCRHMSANDVLHIDQSYRLPIHLR